VLGQQACEAKSNEITAIPLLLERLALTGALVTIDALGTQTKIAQAILDRGGGRISASRTGSTRKLPLGRPKGFSIKTATARAAR